MSEAPSRKQDQFIVRLPDGMREQIKAEAEANHRSMNAEIVAALEAHFKRPRFFIDPGPPVDPFGPVDEESLDDYVPHTVPPEVREAMEKVIAQIADDARRRLNEWLWLQTEPGQKPD